MPRKRIHCIFALSLTLFSSFARAKDGPEIKVVRSRTSGNASFVKMTDGSALPVAATTAAAAGPLDFFRQYSGLFGIRDADQELRLIRSTTDELGQTHTVFAQVHGGVRVFGGTLRAHQNNRGEIIGANGAFFTISPKVDSQPALNSQQVRQIVGDAFGAPVPTFDRVELVIVDPGWYGDKPQGERLAWYVHVSDRGAGLAEAFFVDAHSGRILDRWSLVETARNRRIHNAGNSSILPGPVARTEGQGPNFDNEVNQAYDYAGDTYDYYFRAFDRDGFSGNGALMIASVNSTATMCPNAFWDGTQTAFCPGLALDDVVGHEFTHAVTQYTADLIYQNQPGQLNESFSDVFGELIDLFNGDVSLPGPPEGPAWPVTGSGPGLDLGNAERTSCIGGVRVDVLGPASIAGSYAAARALFGPQLNQAGITGELVAASPPDTCLPLAEPANGKIVLIDRGSGCSFAEKVMIAQDAGAGGVVIANDREGPMQFLTGSGSGVSIPSVGISQEDGALLYAALVNGPVFVKLVANDASGVRWLVAEDGMGNQFRDMWMPSCLGDPDTANHPYQTCSPYDNGGVHSGSGVPNHAFALVTDGGTFNGYAIEAIGPIKSGAVWYRALTTYLTEVSDFEDAYVGLTQAAADLVRTFPRDPRTGDPSTSMFTSQDAAQVSLALEAVEMNTPGRCGSFDSVLNPDPYEACHLPVIMYSDGFENGTPDWTVSNTNPPTPYDWILRTGLPGSMTGEAWFVGDPNIGNCQTEGEAAVHSLTSPLVFVWDEAREIILSFTHRVATEPAYDGGNVKISVNEGPFELIPSDAYRYNAYNAAIPDNSSNPLAGQPAFTGRGAVWGTSYVDLTSRVHGGDLVQFRFDFGKDACGGEDGWYLSELSLSYCIPEANGDFDFDNKVTLADVAQFENCMLTSVRGGGPCVPADLNGSGFVTFLDFTPFIKLLDDPGK